MGETETAASTAVDNSDNTNSPTEPVRADRKRWSGGGAGAQNLTPHSDTSCSLKTGSNSARSQFSLARMSLEKRARRVRFYRNGDRFFKGMVCAVSAERFRTLESLLASLTSSPLCDKRVMPHGVRHIFTADGARKVDSLDQLQEGQSYVCASTDVFRTLDYSQNEDPTWAFVYPPSGSVTPASLEHTRDERPKTSSLNGGQRPSSGQRPDSGQEQQPSSFKPHGGMSQNERRQYEDYQRSYVVPRLITVIKQGKRPRDAVRLLLNRKTARTFDQVMDDISEAVKMDCGSVKKLYAISGKLITCLADFFEDDILFLACGPERVSGEDLELDRTEVRQVSAYRPFNGRSKERVTLRRKCSGHSHRPTTSGSLVSDGTTDVSDAHAGKSSHASEKSDNGVASSIDKDGFDISTVPMPELLSLKYDIGALIGTGNFAVVLECKDKTTRRKYALKIINKDSCKGREKMLDNEVRILRRVKHPNIIRLIEDYSHQHRVFYIMELVKGGDLFDAIASSTKYTEQDASGILYNLASALQYLHSLKIVHRDVKPENLLIRQHEDGTKSLKLGDFGLATEVHNPLFTVCGTPTYVAPEVIAETGYGVKIDIWSAGVITYILLCGFPPFVSETDNQAELFDLIMSASFEFPSPYWNDVSEQAKNLVKRMLEIDPDARLSAKEVLQDAWVASDTTYKADLRRVVSSGLSTHFRRGNRPPYRNAGIQIIATTALDKASRFFKGRKSLQDRGSAANEG